MFVEDAVRLVWKSYIRRLFRKVPKPLTWFMSVGKDWVYNKSKSAGTGKGSKCEICRFYRLLRLICESWKISSTSLIWILSLSQSWYSSWGESGLPFIKVPFLEFKSIMKKQAASFRILACRRLTVGIERQRPASSGCFPISRNSSVKKTVRAVHFQKQSERQMVFGQRYLVEAVLCRKNRREIEGLAFEA